MSPTQPNRTGKATVADRVMTPRNVAQKMVDEFQPRGVCLEPCRGTGSIYTLLPPGRKWCEITEGRDFFDFKGRVDWILTNPPYSIYDAFLAKCFEVADNVVFLCPVAKALKSLKIERMVDAYGGLTKIHLLGGGRSFGFGFGFPVGFLHYRRGYSGPIERSSPFVRQAAIYGSCTAGRYDISRGAKT